MRIFNLLKSAKKINYSKKRQLKEKFFCIIEENEFFKEKIFSEAKTYSLDNVKKSLLREKIYEKLSKPLFVFDIFYFQKIFKKTLSFSMMFFLVFGFFRGYISNENVVFADVFTKIESFSGDVLVYRDDFKLKVYSGMELKKRDVVVTKDDSFVNILYLDDSVSRLNGNTTLLISELASFDKKGFKTYIEIEIVRGVVWNKVLNLVEEGSSFVVRADDVYAKAKKASFNVEVAENKTELSVFKNNVEIHTPFAGERLGNVVTGQKMVLDKEKNSIEVQKLESAKKSDVWIVENLSKDKEYLASVEERLVENTQKSLLEREIILFNDVEKEKLDFLLAEKNFMEAQLVLIGEEKSLEEIEMALLSIDSFSENYKNYSDFIDKVSEIDEKYAFDLRKSLDETMIKHKKNLNLILPDSPVYVAKQELKKISYFDLEGEDVLTKKKLDDLKENLIEAEEMANKGELGIAKEIVDDSIKVVREVKEVVSVMENEDKLSLEIFDSELMVSNLKENIIPEAGEVFNLIETGKYGTSVIGGKEIDPLLDLK